MEFSKQFVTLPKLIIFGVIYTTIYVFLALLGLGAEPKAGTTVFLAPIFTWPFVLVALFLTLELSELRNRTFFVIILFVHYLITAYLLTMFRPRWNWPEVWKRSASFIVFTVVWYVGGQVLIWIPLFASFNAERLKQETR